MLKLFAAVTLSAAAGMIGSWLLTAMGNIWSWLSPTIVNIGSWILTNLVNAGCVLGTSIVTEVVTIGHVVIDTIGFIVGGIYYCALHGPITMLLSIIMSNNKEVSVEGIIIVGLILDATPLSSYLSAKIESIVNLISTGLGMIGHGLAVLGNGLLAGLGMIGHGLAVMGSWIVTNTVTLANLFYTAAAAHPVIAIAIAIPLLVLASPLIISSYREFFNSKGAHEVKGPGQSSSIASDKFSQKPDNFPAGDANENITYNSAQPANTLFSYLGF